MKAAVLKPFLDKYTGNRYTPGTVLTMERERFSEIREAIGDSYIAEIVDPDAAPVPEEPDSSSLEQENNGEVPSEPEGPDGGGTQEPESGEETPAAEAPPEPPKSRRKKKE